MTRSIYAGILSLIIISLFCVSAQASVFEEGTYAELVHRMVPKDRGHDFSGLTRIPSSSEYLILDDSCRITRIDLGGSEPVAKETVTLEGLDDCEGIAVVREDPESLRLALVEERRGNVVFFDLSPATQRVSCPAECETHFIDQPETYWTMNRGLEAMTLQPDSEGPRFFFGKEERPRKVIVGKFHDNRFQGTELWSAETLFPAGSDVAGMDYFEGSLFVLDERMDRVREINPETGEILHTLKLPQSGWSLRYEGLAFERLANSLRMVIVAERNDVLVFGLVNNPDELEAAV